MNIYMEDLKQLEKLNCIDSKYFRAIKSVKICVEVRGLPKGVKFEIDAICLLPRIEMNFNKELSN